MQRHEELYKGKRIVVEEEENRISITIDGDEIPVTKDDQYRRYLSVYLPYFSFVSPLELAREVVDHPPDLRGADLERAS